MSDETNELGFTSPLILQGNYLEDLRHLMVNWMKANPLPPFEDEVILVQSNGIAQWLKLALAADAESSSGLGIAAGIHVMLPGRFIWQAYRKLYPELPSASPFDKGPLTWRLLAMLNRLEDRQAIMADPDLFAPLKHFLNHEPSIFRTWQLAARLADLFDQYQIYRADWLAAWLNHDDVLIRAKGQHEDLPSSQRWQPELWRWLHQEIETSHSQQSLLSYASRARVHQHFCETLKDAIDIERIEGIPKRIIVFGISSLPRQTLEVLDRLAPYTQVMLFVCNPSEHYWGDLVEGRELFRRAYRRQPDKKMTANLDENVLHLHGHPLLAAWGRQGRDYLRLLDEYDNTDSYRAKFENIDLFTSPQEDNLLHQLQKDIFDLRPLSERQEQKTRVAKGDRSLSFMVAHSPQREVEILQDQLLAEFELAQQRGDVLSPRDILVMVPDIQDYAAHIDAVFGKLDRKDPRYLPFHIADQGQRHKAPLLIALEHLLHLPESRFSVSELLDLLEVPALRQRFELNESDCAELKHWIQGANIRWGLDAKQRGHLDLPEVAGNSWRFGLKRMLLGYATGEQDAWQGTLPYSEVAGLGATKLGALVELLDQLEAHWLRLQTTATPLVWVERIRQLLNDFFKAESDQDLSLLLKIEKQLDAWQSDLELAEVVEKTTQERAEKAHDASSELELSLEVVREEVLNGLDQQSLNQTFFAGSVNFATLMPMRAIPFKQIWLLGMNDGAYPRAVRPVDFDLMANDYRPGDRSRREDDRYLFLEALLSARDKLVISWVGRNIRDNSVRPPSVLVGQLRDHLKAGWLGQSEDLLAELTTEHPLQPFSANYFTPNPSTDGKWFSYASEWLAVHQPHLSEGDTSALPTWQPESALSVDQLVRHLQLPIDSFYALRLQVPRQDQIQQLKDSENFSFDGLGHWQLNDHLIQTALIPAQDSPQFMALMTAQIRRLQQEGTLVEGSLGEYHGQQLIEGLAPLYDVWAEKVCQYTDRLDPQTHRLEFATSMGGLAVEVVLDALYQDPETGEVALLLLQTSHLFSGTSKHRWRHFLKGWLLHLLAQQAGIPVTTHVMSPQGQVTFTSSDPLNAVNETLCRLMESVHLSLQQPFLLSVETAIEWLSLQEKFNPSDFSLLEVETAMLKALQTAQERSRFLQHHCHHLDELWMNGDFDVMTQTMYGDFYAAVKPLKKEKRS